MRFILMKQTAFSLPGLQVWQARRVSAKSTPKVLYPQAHSPPSYDVTPTAYPFLSSNCLSLLCLLLFHSILDGISQGSLLHPIFFLNESITSNVTTNTSCEPDTLPSDFLKFSHSACYIKRWPNSCYLLFSINRKGRRDKEAWVSAGQGQSQSQNKHYKPRSQIFCAGESQIGTAL